MTSSTRISSTRTSSPSVPSLPVPLHVPEVISSPRLIWAKSAEREAESSVLELTGAGGGGGPGGGGATPAGGAGGALDPPVATGPWKSREEERHSNELRLCRGGPARLTPQHPAGASTHGFAPDQPYGVVLFDVGLQLCPDAQVSFHPVYVLFISEDTWRPKREELKAKESGCGQVLEQPLHTQLAEFNNTPEIKGELTHPCTP